MIQFSTFNKIVQPEEFTNEYELTCQQVTMTETQRVVLLYLYCQIVQIKMIDVYLFSF